MASDADRILHVCIDKLRVDRAYSTSAAAAGAVDDILALDCLRPLDIPHTLPYVMDGLKHRAKAYRGADDRTDLQHDFARIDTSFARLIYAPVALDEAPGTTRMPPVDMTLPELRKHVGLKYRKSDETRSNAEILDRFIDAHEYWESCPELPLREILRRDLEEDAGSAA